MLFAAGLSKLDWKRLAPVHPDQGFATRYALIQGPLPKNRRIDGRNIPSAGHRNIGEIPKS